MRLISLNVWGGTVYEPLMDFIKTESESADIFCLQEVFKKATPHTPVVAEKARLCLYEELERQLPNFNGCFVGTSQGHTLSGPVDYPTIMGEAIFVNKNYHILKSDIYPIFGDYHDVIKPDFSNTPRGLQHVQIQAGGNFFHVFNYHGIPKPGDKQDTPERLTQSEKISSILKGIDAPKILCGDFNLYPNTQSIIILEQGMENLVRKHFIANTRNELSWSKHGNTTQHFADYIFISPHIKEEKFIVPYNEISDHLPLILEFDL